MKNRSNVVAAIIQNADVLKGAYYDAFDSEGSSDKELSTYMDSIQGHIDQFNNAVQTMWMNFIDSDVIKFFVDIGTWLIELINKVGVLQSLFATLFTKKVLFSKNKLDLASLLGIHDVEKGFSVLGKQGLSKQIVKLFSGIKKRVQKIKINREDVISDDLLNADDIGVSAQDFAEAISTNIDDFVTLDTSKIDEEISAVQNKLTTAREQLASAKAADWDYYKSLGSMTPAQDRDLRISEKTQEIAELETQLSSLQEKRDDIVSSAAENVADSVLSQGEVELSQNEAVIQSYESMFDVLSEIKGAKLDIGDEGHASKVITEISNAASQGQDTLRNYISTLDDNDVALQAYAASVTDGNYSLAGFQQFIQQHNNGLEQSTAKAIASTAAHVALNAAISMGISFLISTAISAIQSFVNAEKEAAEAAKDAVIESQKLTETKSSLDDYVDQINKLRDELDSGNLTQSEAYDTRKKLLTIQDELISKYGLEKDGINLVTGAIQDQIDAINELSRAEADQWLIKHQKEINDAVDYFDDDKKYSDKGQAFDNWGVTKRVKQKVGEYARDREHIHVHDGSITGQYLQFSGSAEEVKAEAEEFSAWLDDYEADLQRIINGETGATEKEIKQAKKDLQQVQDYREDLGDWYNEEFGENSTYTTNKALIEEAQEKTAITKYSDQYMEILQAQNDFLEAQAKGDEEGMQSALEAYHSAIDEAKKVATEDYMDDFFDEMDDEFATEEFELNLMTDKDGLKTEIQDTINNSGLVELDDNQIKDMVSKELNVEGALAGDTGYTQKQVDGLIELQAKADAAGISIKTLISILANLGFIEGQPIEAIAKSVEVTGKAYSMLTTEVEKYKDINDTVNELTYDGIEISEDQYEALEELIGTEKEFADCIDTTDGYIVKDIALTKQLIDKKKEELAAETKLAKHQAQLEYYDLVKELDMVVEGYNGFTDAEKEAADSLLEQIRTVKNSINQYQLLEDSLLGVTNAFDDFANAQELDEQNTYGDSYVEMAQTMYDAIYKTGEVGSKAFWAAVEAYVPEEYYINLTPGTEQLSAITEYLNKYVFSTLTLDDGSFSIDYSAVEDFVEKAQRVGIFTGTDASAFGLSADFLNGIAEGENGLAKFAEQMGMTETQVYAFLTTMDKYNANGAGLSVLFELDKSTTGQITLATNQLEQLYEQRKVLIEQRDELAESGGDVTAINVQLESNWQDIAKAESTLASLEEQAQDTAKAYIEVESAKSSISTTDTFDEALAKIPEGISTELSVELNGAETAEDVLQILTDYQTQLQTPTVMELEIEKDKVQSELSAIENQVEGIQDQVVLGEDGIYQAAEGVIVDENLQTYINLLNEESVIESTLSSVLSTSEQYLSEIAENTATMAGKEVSSETQEDSGTSSTTAGGGQASRSAGGGRNDLADNTVDGVEISSTSANQDDEMPIVVDISIELAKTYDDYKNDIERLGQLGFDPTETIFGNIDTNDRQVLEWDENNLNKYKKALISWYDDMSWDDIVNNFSGTLSTVMGSSAEYDGIEIAFSPMLQTENGPVLLDRNTVDEYIWQLIDTANAQFGEGNWTGQDLINLDAQGLELYGQTIKGLLADVGETAIQTGEAMHYTGAYGSIEQGYRAIEAAANEAGVTTDEMLDRLASGEDINIGAEADTESAEKAGQEIADTAQDSADAVTVDANTSTGNKYGLWNTDTSTEPKSVKTYSQLQTDFESLDDVLSQTEEIIGNGTEVTESYKEALAELLDVEVSELDEYFEESNDLIVKNADGLKKLVKQAKNNTKQNVKLAKSQAKLEYYDLYKDLKQLTSGLEFTSDGYANLSDAQRAELNSLYEEMNVVKSAIAQFSLLEAQLLGTTNAYTKFAEAQTLDSENDYSEQAETMVQTFAEGLNTGKLGTAAVREAMLALVPEEVYANLDTFEERMDAVAKYFNEGEISTYFSIDFDDDGNISSVEITEDNLKQFVENGVEKGVFTGDWEHFDLAADVTSLEQFAEAMGITTEVAFAMFSALENYDAGNLFDPSNILEKFASGDIEYQAYQNTQALADLEYQLANGAITVEEYRKRMYGLDGQLADGAISPKEHAQAVQLLNEQLAAGMITQQEYNEALYGLSGTQAEIAKNAYDDVFVYYEISAALTDAKDRLEEYYQMLETGVDGDGNPIDVDQVNADIEATTQEINGLVDELSELEEPIDIVIDFAADYLDEKIDDVKEDIKQLTEDTTVVTTIETKFEQIEESGFDLSQFGLTRNEDGSWNGIIKFIQNIGLDPTAPGVMEAVTEYLDLVDQEHTLSLQMGSETDTVVTTLQSIDSTLRAIAEWLGADYTLDVNTNLNTDSVTDFINTPLSKTISVTVKKVGSWLSGLFANGTVHANSTAHMSGTAHATGSWGAPKTETALVGELGEELIVRNGRWFTVGSNGAEFTDIQRGDIIK